MPISADEDAPKEEDFPDGRDTKAETCHPSKNLPGFKPNTGDHPLEARARMREIPVARLDEGARWLETGGGALEEHGSRLETRVYRLEPLFPSPAACG